MSVALAGLVRPSAAPAEETPTPVAHLAPYNLDWLAYIPPEDAPPVTYAVCIVDTGVAITPDTPPDDPVNGPILKRIATDGGPGTPQTADNALHGTYMAFASIAPQNDWGTVGVWPFGRVISVRASVNNESSLRFGSYPDGLSRCTSNAARNPIAAALWALACPTCSMTDSQRDLLAEGVRQARNAGMAVVAAAGNQPGKPEGPASVHGVIPVAAGTASGGLCPGSADAAAILVAPACPAESADPLTGVPQTFGDGGTSSASAATASLFAMLRSYRPAAAIDQIEGWIADTAQLIDGRHVINGEAAARAAGLGALVERARARQAGSPMVVVMASPTPTPIAVPRRIGEPAPEGARYVRGRFSARIPGWPVGFDLVVSVRGERFRYAQSSSVVLRQPRPPRAILMRFASQSTPYQRSSWIKLVRRADGRRYSLAS